MYRCIGAVLRSSRMAPVVHVTQCGLSCLVFVDYLLRRIHPDESRRHDADPTPAAVVRSPSPPPSPAVSSDVARPHLVSRLYTVTERPRDYVAVDADDDVAASGEDSRTSDDDEESQPG